MTERGGPLRRVLHRLSADRAELEAADLQGGVEEHGATPIAEVIDRSEVYVAGTLRTVTLRPRAGVPTLEAELYDGSGAIDLVWLGRRRIAGIEPGAQLVARGRVSVGRSRRVLYNPDYRIVTG